MSALAILHQLRPIEPYLRYFAENPVFKDLHETLPYRGDDMNELSFGWQEQEPLSKELIQPIARLSLEFAFHGRPVYVTLWRPDGSGLLVHSDMQGVAEGIEVGVLHFGRVFASEAQEIIMETPLAFRDGSLATKLTIEESGTRSDSGIVLLANSGEEIFIVTGAQPYSIAVRGVGWPNYTFEPEYDLDRYQRTGIF
jgi:hypothetical protein